MLRYIAAAVIAFVFVSPALAKNDGKLPKDAVPLTAAETKALWSGKTINWNPAKMYWSPDGKAVGVYPVKGREGFAEGTWTVSGNEMCSDVIWYGADKGGKTTPENSCAKYYKAGKVIWTLNTKEQERYMGDIWSGVDKKLKKGDSASKQAYEWKKKWGY